MQIEVWILLTWQHPLRGAGLGDDRPSRASGE